MRNSQTVARVGRGEFQKPLDASSGTIHVVMNLSLWSEPMKISAVIALFALLITGSQVATAQDASSRFKVGEPFPDLVFPSIENGQPASITQYRGRKVLLHIFASW